MPAIGGGVVVADEAGRGAVAGRADGGSGSSGRGHSRGKELAGADDGTEAEGDGETTSADAGAVGGGDMGEWRADKSSAKSEHMVGSGSSRAGDEQAERRGQR